MFVPLAVTLRQTLYLLTGLLSAQQRLLVQRRRPTEQQTLALSIAGTVLLTRLHLPALARCLLIGIRNPLNHRRSDMDHTSLRCKQSHKAVPRSSERRRVLAF